MRTKSGKNDVSTRNYRSRFLKTGNGLDLKPAVFCIREIASQNMKKKQSIQVYLKGTTI